MTKVAIVVNGKENSSLYPSFILGSSALAWDADTYLFFTPGAAPALKPGYLEDIKSKGMPDMDKLVKDFNQLGGKLILCVLALEAKDLKKEELRTDIEIMDASTFMEKILDANVTFSF